VNTVASASGLSAAGVELTRDLLGRRREVATAKRGHAERRSGAQRRLDLGRAGFGSAEVWPDVIRRLMWDTCAPGTRDRAIRVRTAPLGTRLASERLSGQRDGGRFSIHHPHAGRWSSPAGQLASSRLNRRTLPSSAQARRCSRDPTSNTQRCFHS